MKGRLLAPAVLAALALAAAGCGGSSSSSASDTTPTNKWADNLCSSITTWTSSLSSIVGGLQPGGLTKDSLQTAVDDAKTATDTFTTSLGNLGKPDTGAGQQAQASVDQLSTEIQADLKTIEDAVNGASGVSGVLNAVTVTKSTLTKAGTQVSDTLTGFQDLDAKGEIEAAFKQSDSCKKLTGGN
jgi:hypothetical protein